MSKILVFPANLLTNVPKSGVLTHQRKVKNTFSKILNSGKLEFVERESAEKDTSILQIIPYCVLRSSKCIFCYKRTKKGGESRLHDLYSLGVGGHLEECDLTEDWLTTYKNCVNRELEEEVGLVVSSVGEPSAIIYDKSTSVGLVHCGLTHFIDVPDDFAAHTQDIALSNGGFETVEMIKSLKDNFENWSKLIIENLL